MSKKPAQQKKKKKDYNTLLNLSHKSGMYARVGKFTAKILPALKNREKGFQNRKIKASMYATFEVRDHQTSPKRNPNHVLNLKNSPETSRNCFDLIFL